MRSAAIAVVILAALPSVSVAGIDLSWNQCVTDAPADGAVWTCAPGEVTNLFANFQLPQNISNFVAMDAVLDIELGTAVPPFWQFQTGGCNPSGVNVLDDRPVSCSAASNPSPWGAGGAASDAFITAYAPGYGATNRARLLVTVARASSSPTPLVAGQNYFGFHLAFSSDASASCPGCNTPAEITWTSGTFFAPTGGPGGGALSVVVTDPGLRSKKVTVNGGLSGVTGFELFSIAPNRGSSGGPVNVVVTGRDILPGATLRLIRPLASPIVATGVTVAADGRSISGTFNLTTEPDGLWDVEVTNPGGSTARLGSAFTIDAGLSLTSVTPFELPAVGTAQVVVQGGGFEPGIDVRLRRLGLLDVVGSVTSIAADGRSLNCTFHMTGSAPGVWDLVAANLNGETATLAGAIRVLQAPGFQSISPSTIGNAGPITFVVTGQLLDAVTAVSFEKAGQAPRVASGLTHGGSTSLQFTCDFAGAVLGPWDLVLSVTPTFSVRAANVLLVVVAPTLTSIVPNQASNGAPFTVTVNGENFVPGVFNIELRRPGAGTLVAGGAVAADGRSAVGTFNPNFAIGGARDVVVSNASIPSNVLTNGFTLLQAPRTNYVTPSTGPNTGPITVRASGSGYLAGASVRLLRSGIPDLVGTGVTVGPSDTSLTATFDLTNAAAGPWDFAVSNPSGLQGILPGGFTVIATPVIDSIVPNRGGQQVSALLVTIYGRRFSPALSVQLRSGVTTRNATNVSVIPAGTQVSATFNLVGLPLGQYDVVTTNLPGGTATLPLGFRVLPVVTLNAPVPAFGLDTTSAQVLTITGSSLQPGAVVSLTNGSTTLVGTNVVVNGAGNSLTATFDLRAGFEGFWTLNVSNPDGSFGSRGSAFRIDRVPIPVSVAPTSAVNTEILSSLQVTGTQFTFGSQIALVRDGGATVPADGEAVTANGTLISGSIDLRNVATGLWHVRVTNSTGTGSGTLINAFTVLAGPRITAINPVGSEPIQAFDATVSGSALQPGAQVELRSSAPTTPTIAGTNEVTSPGGDQITVRFDLVGHVPGLRNVVVTNPDGHSATLVNGFSVLTGPALSLVSPTSAPDSGAVVLSIGGSGLSQLAQVWLRRTGEANINGSVISVNPAGTLLHAVFDLEGKPLGLWDIVVQNPSGGTAVLPTAFEIRFVGPTSPAGLDLTWSACNLPSTGGSSAINFDCGNPGFQQTLYANFQSPVPVPDFIALDAVIDINTEATSLPDFWQFDPAGCNANGLIIADAMALSACPSGANINPWGPGGSAADAFITAYVSNYAGGPRARMLISVVRSSTDPFSIAGGANHFGFSLTWTGDLTICDGCATPAEITWTSALLHSAAAATSVPISGTGARSSVASVNGGLAGMHLTSIVPDRLTLGTLPRVRVFGRQLNGTSVALTRPGLPNITGFGIVYDADGRGLSASFDLRAVMSGRWSLEASGGGDNDALLDAVRLLPTIPEVIVLAPIAGEIVPPNRDYLVQWEAVDDELVTSIDVYLSRSGPGGPWELLAYGLSNSGSALIRINGPTTNNAYMRVVANDGDGNQGSGQNGPFYIQSATATLVARFEAVRADDGAEVTWTFETPERVARVDLDRSPSESGPWTPVQGERETLDGTTVVRDRDPAAPSSRYRLRATTTDGTVVTFGPIAVATGGYQPIAMSGVSSIAPNPASRRARIRMAVAREGPVRLSVLDLQGREVAVLADQVFKAGMHDLAWDARSDGRSLPPGLYFVRFADASRRQVTRLVLTP